MPGSIGPSFGPTLHNGAVMSTSCRWLAFRTYVLLKRYVYLTQTRKCGGPWQATPPQLGVSDCYTKLVLKGQIRAIVKLIDISLSINPKSFA